MDRKKALERVFHLIAIATDPSQIKDGEPSEQARTSAFIACKTIREHNLLEGSNAATKPSPTSRTKGDSPPSSSAPSSSAPSRRKKRSWSEAWRRTSEGERPRPRPRPSVERPSVEDQEFERRYGGAPGETRPREGTSESFGENFRGRRGHFTRAPAPGACLYCGFAVEKGDEVYEMPGFGFDHKACTFKRAGLKVE